MLFLFFFQAEDGIRDKLVTGVQTCALPISACAPAPRATGALRGPSHGLGGRRASDGAYRPRPRRGDGRGRRGGGPPDLRPRVRSFRLLPDGEGRSRARRARRSEARRVGKEG